MKVLGICVVLLSWSGYVIANMEELAAALPSCGVGRHQYAIVSRGIILIYPAAMHGSDALRFPLRHHKPNVYVYEAGL
jgi:hypothetical protein